MEESKQKSPYHGFWVIVLAMVIVPLVLWGTVYGLLCYYRPHQMRFNVPGAQFLGFGMGSLFHMSCVIGGLLRDSYRAVVYRVREFFENLVCSPLFALRCYWEDVKADGLVFTICIIIIGTCLGLTLDGLIRTLALL